MKIAMIHASDALAKAKVRSRIILQIHDELVVEIAPRRSRAGDGPGARRHGARGRSRRALDVSTGIGSDWQLAAH